MDSIFRREDKGAELDRFFTYMVAMRDDPWITEFHPQVHRPITKSMDEQREHALPHFVTVLKLLLDRGELRFVDDEVRFGEYKFVASSVVRQRIADLPGIKFEFVNDTIFGLEIMNAFALGAVDPKERRKLKRHSGYEGRWWPKLNTCQEIVGKIIL